MNTAPHPRPAPAVVKLGGSAVDGLDTAWWDDLARLGRSRPLVLVHGWSKPLKTLRARHRDPSAILRDRYGNQSRWTTPEVIDDIKAVSARLGDERPFRARARGVPAFRRRTCPRFPGAPGVPQRRPGDPAGFRPVLPVTTAGPQTDPRT